LPLDDGANGNAMKRKISINISVFFTLVVALVLILSGASSALAGPRLDTPINSDLAGVTAGNKGYLTIPAAAFQPYLDGYDYENGGGYMKHLHSPGGGNVDGLYIAPVFLPHGATVTRMIFYFYDNTVGTEAYAWLRRSDMAGNVQNMAYVSSDFATGYGSKSDSSISYASIDNAHYAYWAEWRLPISGIRKYLGLSVIIEYNEPAVKPNPDYISIPAAAFVPWWHDYDYLNWGRELLHYHTSGGGATAGTYLAPVHLPDGATVTRMTSYFYDSVTGTEVWAWLHRTDLKGLFDSMAAVESQWDSGYASRSESTIMYSTIDNSHYGYHAVWYLPVAPTGQYKGCGLVIEFTNPTTAKNVISASAGAFGIQYEDGYFFYNHGRYLFHLHSPGGGVADGKYLTPVALPQGATLTKMQFYWNDQSTGDHGTAKLQRARLGTVDLEDMASASTQYLPTGYGDSADATIAGATVDNTRYAYWLLWTLPVSTGGGAGSGPNNIGGNGVILEYNYRSYLPMIRK
jgi:hypothetical protein